MVVLDQGPEPLVENMGVNLGGGYIGMSQHLLDAPEIGAVGEKVAGEGVAEHMGRDAGAKLRSAAARAFGPP